MLFVLIGIGVVVAHFMGWGPMAAWNWDLEGDIWKFAAPFVLALVWWKFSDISGLSGRRAMAKERERQAERQRARVEKLGHQGTGASRRPPGSSS